MKSVAHNILNQVLDQSEFSDIIITAFQPLQIEHNGILKSLSINPETPFKYLSSYQTAIIIRS